jgi:hypothetical protein
MRRAAVNLVADVVVRRAHVHATSGKLLTAISDVQQAVMDVLSWASRDQGSSARVLGAARVLALASHVELLGETDPDIAADWALQAYVGSRQDLAAQLTPFLIMDSKARATAIDCLRWQQGAYTAAGDTAATARIAQALQTLSSTPA